MMRHWKMSACILALTFPSAGQALDSLVLLAEDTPGVTRIKINVAELPFSVEKPSSGVIDFVTPHRFQSVNAAEILAGGAARRVVNARLVPDELATRMRLVLNCDCGFDFSVSGGVLSLRIKDPETSEGAAVADGEDAQLVEAELNEPKASASKRPAPNRAPVPLSRPSAQPTEEIASDSGARDGASTNASTSGLPPLDPDAKLSKPEEVVLARDHLMKQLSRAAEQGLIQFVSEEAASQAPAIEPVAVAEKPATAPEVLEEEEQRAVAAETPKKALPAEIEEAPAAPRADVEIPLRARTAVDRDFTPDRRETRVEVAYCIEEERLDIAGWSQPGPFLDTNVRLKSELLDEFDQPRPEFATKLARHLTVNGFGAEAIQMVKAYGDVIEDSELLTDIAGLMDARKPMADGFITRTAPCHPKAALWRAIGNLPDGDADTNLASADEQSQINRGLLEAFAKLPVVTRRILGARLMDNLIAKGELDLANQLDLILLRSPEMQDDALALSRARLLAETGRLEEAEELYQRLGQTNRPEAYSALILLLESRINRGAGGSRELSDALGDAAFAARNTPMELPLKVAEIRSRALTNGAMDALGVLLAEMERSGGPTKLLQDVGHAALEKITPVQGDILDYAKAVMALAEHVSTDRTGDLARQHVAEILVDAGLPKLALEFLEPARRRPNEKTAILAARSLTALDQYGEALSALEGYSSKSAIALRVQILERMGRFDEANHLSANLEDEADTAQSARAFRAGDWSAAASSDDEAKRTLAEYMSSRTTPTGAEAAAISATGEDQPRRGDKEATLDAVRALVDGSRSSRSTIEKALEDG